MSIYIFRSVILLIIGVLLQCCVQKNTSAGIYFEKDFQELQKEAEQQDCNFCVVLSQPECPPCEWYYSHIYTDTYQSLRNKTLFNFVNITQPENHWYQQLIASKGVPASLFFSSEGKLLAVISGSNKASFDCLTRVADKSYHCSSYSYKSPILQSTSYQGVIELFNTTLQAKLKTDRGEDASAEIKQSLDIAVYPYNLWLQMEAAKQQKEESEAIAAAKSLLAFKEPLYAVLYADLYTKAEHIAAPGLTAEDMPKLSVENTELDLGICHVGDSIDFTIVFRSESGYSNFTYNSNRSGIANFSVLSKITQNCN